MFIFSGDFGEHDDNRDIEKVKLISVEKYINKNMIKEKEKGKEEGEISI